MSVLRQKQFGVILQSANKPTGGTVFSASTVFDSRLAVINQVTPNQTLSLPNLLGTVELNGAFNVRVRNAGSVPFAMHGATVSPNTVQDFTWHDVGWIAAGAAIDASNVLLPSPLTGRVGNNVAAVLVEINTDVLSHDADMTLIETHDFVSDLNI